MALKVPGSPPNCRPAVSPNTKGIGGSPPKAKSFDSGKGIGGAVKLLDGMKS